MKYIECNTFLSAYTNAYEYTSDNIAFSSKTAALKAASIEKHLYDTMREFNPKEKIIDDSNIINGPWSMSNTALINTLNLIFTLNYKTHLLCIKDNEATFLKINPNLPRPNIHVNGIHGIQHVTPPNNIVECYYRYKTDHFKDDPLFNDLFDSVQDPRAAERQSLRSEDLPPCIIVFNYDDSHLLRKDFGYPFIIPQEYLSTTPFIPYRQEFLNLIISSKDDALGVFNMHKNNVIKSDTNMSWRENFRSKVYNDYIIQYASPPDYVLKDLRVKQDDPLTWGIRKNYLPIIGFSGHTDYFDIASVGYEEYKYVCDYKESNPTHWEDKIPSALFRGGITGCGIDIRSNIRLHLAYLSKIEERDLPNTILKIDAALLINKQKIIYDSIRKELYNHIPDIHMYRTIPSGSYMGPEEQSRYKYIIHVDGFVAAGRLLKSIMLQSVMLKIESPTYLWFSHLLKEGETYISIDPTLTNLETQINDCITKDAEAKKIAQDSYKLIKPFMNKSILLDIMNYILWRISDKVEQNDSPVHVESIEHKYKKYKQKYINLKKYL